MRAVLTSTTVAFALLAGAVACSGGGSSPTGNFTLSSASPTSGSTAVVSTTPGPGTTASASAPGGTIEAPSPSPTPTASPTSAPTTASASSVATVPPGGGDVAIPYANGAGGTIDFQTNSNSSSGTVSIDHTVASPATSGSYVEQTVSLVFNQSQTFLEYPPAFTLGLPTGQPTNGTFVPTYEDTTNGTSYAEPSNAAVCNGGTTLYVPTEVTSASTVASDTNVLTIAYMPSGSGTAPATTTTCPPSSN